MIWIITLLPCLVLGIILLLYEGLSFKHLGAMARDAGQLQRGKEQIELGERAAADEGVQHGAVPQRCGRTQAVIRADGGMQ